VRAVANGYRSEGLQFRTNPMDIPVDLLTSTQISRLKADRMLECRVVEEPVFSQDDQDELERLKGQDAQLQELVPFDWNGSVTEYIRHLHTQLAKLAVAPATAPVAAPVPAATEAAEGTSVDVIKASAATAAAHQHKRSK
jgi:hypothetical protein